MIRVYLILLKMKKNRIAHDLAPIKPINRDPLILR